MKKAKNFKAVLFLILGFIILNGCMDKSGNKDTENQPPMTYNTDGTTNMDVAGDEERTVYKKTSLTSENQQDETEIPTQQQQRLIIRTGTMNLEIETYGEAETKINDLVKNLNGYTSASSSSLNAAGKKQGSITIKVPAEKFDELVAKLGEIGTIASQNISSNDVTEEYIDLEARLKTERELEQRLISLLDTKAGSLSDIIEIEGKLATVRQKIESVEGRMKFLRTQAAYSTLTVSVFEPSLLDTSSGGGFFYEIGQAFKQGLEGFTDVLKAIIVVAIALLPLLVFLAIVVYIVIRIIKWYSKRKGSKAVVSKA
ncbi:MAG: DUF4349 domain-containing protein [Ignavibacteriae bacterium]|nr:DUF4349 domain-containing protein [Ignavibacteriota bacterium]